MFLKTNAQRIPFVIAAGFASALVTACAHKPELKEEAKKTETHEVAKVATVKTTQAAQEVASRQYVIVNFPVGRSTLTENEKQKLAAWSVGIPKKDQVAKFEVLAWADKEYPAEGSKVGSKDEKLADKRADTIKDFFKKDLISKADLKTHNMAKRPGVFSEMFKTEDYDVKNTFEEKGAAPTKDSPPNFRTENKASKALVLVKYE
jgi:hypothetical protein